MRRNILLADDLAKTEVKMWGLHEEQDYKVGNFVRVTSVHIDVQRSDTCLFRRPHLLQCRAFYFTKFHDEL